MGNKDYKGALLTLNDKKILHELISKYRQDTMSLYIQGGINHHTHSKLSSAISYIQEDLQSSIHEATTNQ